MSQRSSRNPLTLTFPAKPPHSPDEMRMRQMKLGLLHFLLALLFSIVIVEQILFYYQLLIAGIFDKLFYQFIHHRLSPPAILVIAVLLLDAAVVYLLSPQMRKALEECFEHHGFARLYSVCSLDSSKRIIRFSQPLALPTSEVAYNVSRSSFHLVEKEQKSTETSSEAAERSIMDSTVTMAQPSGQDSAPALPQGALPEEETISSLQKEDQEVPSIESVESKTYLFILLDRGDIFASLGTEGDEERVKDIIKHPRRKALLVKLYLADGPITREILLKDIYGEDSEATQGLLYQDMSRIRKNIRDEARTAGLSIIDPFESDDQGNWRCTEACRLRGGDLLLSLYQQIKAIREAVEGIEEPEIKVLRKACFQLINSYSGNYLRSGPDEGTYTGGYLSHYLNQDAFKRWAPTIFTKRRNIFMYILQYGAMREHKQWKKSRDGQCLRRAARLYQECAYAATCEPVDSAEGEKALRKCIHMYILDNDREAAQQVLGNFKKRICRVSIDWKKEPETTELIQKFLLMDESNILSNRSLH